MEKSFAGGSQTATFSPLKVSHYTVLKQGTSLIQDTVVVIQYAKLFHKEVGYFILSCGLIN